MALDHGLLNLPLAKRGDIDAQLDAYKAAQRRAAAVNRKASAAQFRADKAQAKRDLAQLLANVELLDSKAVKLGVSRRQLVAHLTDWSKWQPKRLIDLKSKWMPS